jgi:type II secretion system protein H
MNRPRASSAFTLIELVLVMVVLTVLLTIAAPSLRGWSRGTKLRDASDQLLAATRFARSQAVTTGDVYRVEFDVNTSSYRVTSRDGDQFAAVPGEFGRETRLPSEVRLSVAREDGGAGSAIEFHPSGRTTPARISLAADWGETFDIEATTAAEPFRLVSGAPEATR